AYDPTIEDAYRKQTMVDGSVCHIEIVDTAGQEEYSTLRDQWVREGQGFILVYSITERRSFERMETFRQALLRAKSRQPPLFILVGNKCDQTYERQVLKQEGENLGALFPPYTSTRCLPTGMTTHSTTVGMRIYGDKRANRAQYREVVCSSDSIPP
ncbi:unnamed protein product, partial [Rhizoctonia solani]